MSTNWPTVFNAETCIRKGMCPITTMQKPGVQSHSIYFEQHGNGIEKVILIMGLNSSSFLWGRQVELLAKDHSVLVFDNRGVGNSDAPRGPYTTSAMAEDVITLLDFVGWSEGHRNLHIVGISLGGMVAQELVSRIPGRIVSLTLSVTTPGGSMLHNLPPWRGLKTLTQLIFVTAPGHKVAMLLNMLFPAKWLEQSCGDEHGRTNRMAQTKDYLRRLQVTRPQTLMGHLSQMSAGLTHRVTQDRLLAIAASVPKILIITGDEDHLVDPSRSMYLKKNMPQAELITWEGTGHALHTQWPERYFSILVKTFKEGRAIIS